MCGIAVEFNRKGKASRLDLRKIAHRGPDASGEWKSADESIWFGHCRLSILDLTPTGAQPMEDPATGNVIVFNGEIYNHLELRKELTHRWRGTCDTETLLAGYAAWGDTMLHRLKGMFAFVIYDAKAGTLFAARDRLGIKPLYYTDDGTTLRLASETRLLVSPENCDQSLESIAAYLRFGACPESQLLFPKVQSFPAGHQIKVDHQSALHVSRYWPGDRWPTHGGSTMPLDPVKEVRRLIDVAVEEHLLADVPVAVFLSGGVDSSIVAGIAARKVGRRLRTFSVGFRDSVLDETEIAARVARQLGVQHDRVELKPDEVWPMVEEAVACLDLPTVDALNTYIIAKAVSRHGIKVGLSGLGGDELFGGYPSFTDIPKLRWVAKVPSPIWQILSVVDARCERLADVDSTDPGEMALWRRYFWTRKMLRRAGLPEPARIHFPAAPPMDEFGKISWSELTGYMRHMLLRDADQMSMAVSLELRVPFLDHELVEYVLALPAAAKLRAGKNKPLLTEACADVLLPEVSSRPKTGFVLPMAEWMKGPLESFVSTGLREISERRIITQPFLGKLQNRFKSGTLHWTRLWSLVVLGHYLKRMDRVG